MFAERCKIVGMAVATPKNKPAESSKPTPYPYYVLSRALDMGAAVDELGGTNDDVQKSLLAHRMKVEEDSPTLLGLLGAAKLFDIIGGRGTYRLTETARRYFHPTAENERRIAKVQMVKSPPLFSALIDRFDGSKLPASDLLVNMLHREHRINESWRSRAASIFISSIREAGIIDESGFLRYKASLDAANNGTIGGMNQPTRSLEQVPEAPPLPLQEPERILREAGPKNGMVFFTFRGIRLEAPEEMNMELWKKLSDFVSILKPTE